MRGWWRSMPAPARWCGRRPLPTARRAFPTPRPHRHQGQGRAGAAGLRPLPRGALLHQRLRRRTPASCSGSSTPIARNGEPGGDTWGTLPDMMRAGGETWIVGSYDPELDLTYWGMAQAKPWMPASRGNGIKDARSMPPQRSRCAAPTARSPGTTSTSRRSRSISTRCSSACWSTSVRRRWSSASARPASCGSSIAGPASSWATARPCFRTSSLASIPRPACPSIATTSSSRRSTSGLPRVRAPKAGTTGRR